MVVPVRAAVVFLCMGPSGNDNVWERDGLLSTEKVIFPALLELG